LGVDSPARRAPPRVVLAAALLWGAAPARGADEYSARIREQKDKTQAEADALEGPLRRLEALGALYAGAEDLEAVAAPRWELRAEVQRRLESFRVEKKALKTQLKDFRLQRMIITAWDLAKPDSRARGREGLSSVESMDTLLASLGAFEDWAEDVSEREERAFEGALAERERRRGERRALLMASASALAAAGGGWALWRRRRREREARGG